MRTTILLDDELGERLRAEARRLGVSFSQFLADAGRRALDERKREDSATEPFELITFHGAGARPGVDLDKANELLAAEDSDTYGNQGR